jgi:hypothetical protein
VAVVKLAIRIGANMLIGFGFAGQRNSANGVQQSLYGIHSAAQLPCDNTIRLGAEQPRLFRCPGTLGGF